MNDEVDITPVDAQVERRRRSNGAQFAGGHRGFDFFALSGIERAVMQADRQIFIVGTPEFLESKLGLHAGVDEDERQFLRADRVIDFAHRVARRVSGPWDIVLGFEDVDFWLGAARDGDNVGEQRHRIGLCLRYEIAAKFARACDGRGKPDRHHVRCELAQASQIECQEIAPLRRREGMQFIKNDRVEIAKQIGRIGMAQEQRDLLRRCQQDMRRAYALALAARDGCVAGTRLGPDFKSHLVDGLREVARNVGSERLERRHVEREEPGPGFFPGTVAEGHEARQKACKRLAGARGGDEQCRASFTSGLEQSHLVGARRPATPREPSRNLRR